jgi:hypothetical protein
LPALHGEHRNGSGVPLLDVSKAFLLGQFRYLDTGGESVESAISQTSEISGTDEALRRFGVSALNVGLRHSMLRMVESVDPTMVVQCQSNNLAAASNASAQSTTSSNTWHGAREQRNA